MCSLPLGHGFAADIGPQGFKVTYGLLKDVPEDVDVYVGAEVIIGQLEAIREVFVGDGQGIESSVVVEQTRAQAVDEGSAWDKEPGADGRGIDLTQHASNFCVMLAILIGLVLWRTWRRGSIDGGNERVVILSSILVALLLSLAFFLNRRGN